MAAFHSEPRRATPEATAWFHVSTPGVFFEAELALDDDAMTTRQRAAYRKLQRLSEKHGIPILRTSYRVG